MLQQQQGSTPEFLALPTFGDEDEEEDAQPSASGAPPPRRRRWIIIGSIILLLLLLGGVIYAVIANRRPRTMYQQETVTQGNFSLTVNATGPLQAGIYNVTFSGMGILTEIDVKVGQTVQQGQVLARLDQTSLQDAFDVARAGVAAAQTTLNNGSATSGATKGTSGASIDAAQTTLKNAETNLNNVRRASAASIAAAQTALNNANANLQATQQQVQQTIEVANSQVNTACSSPAPTPDETHACETAMEQDNQVRASGIVSVTAQQGVVNAAQKSLNTAQKQADLNNATAEEQVKTAQSSLKSAQAQGNLSNTSAQGTVNSAQSQLNTALDQLKTAAHNLNNATLRAPHTGIVTVINGNVGGTPGISSTSSSTATSTTTNSFIQIVDTSTLQIIANVNESDTGNLKVGEPVQFTVSAYGQRVFNGTVSAIAPNGVTVSNVVTYPVTIDVDQNSLQGAHLLPGMTANVTINVVQRSNVLVIPLSAVNFARTASNPNATTGAPALITKAQATAATNQARQMLSDLQAQNPSISADNPIPAFVLEQTDGTFTAKPVVVGLTDGVVYEVLAGLSLGETIIVGVQNSGGRSSGGSSGGGGGPGGG